MKIKHAKYEHKGVIYSDQYIFFCEGCGHVHAIELGNHSFNGDCNKPTFSPSVLCNWNAKKVCHSFVRDGFIQYLGDCFHSLKSKTVELLDFDKWPQHIQENYSL